MDTDKNDILEKFTKEDTNNLIKILQQTKCIYDIENDVLDWFNNIKSSEKTSNTIEGGDKNEDLANLYRLFNIEMGTGIITAGFQIVGKLITYRNELSQATDCMWSRGGSATIYKKSGKTIMINKKNKIVYTDGRSRKQYIKHNRKFISLSEYRKLISNK